MMSPLLLLLMVGRAVQLCSIRLSGGNTVVVKISARARTHCEASLSPPLRSRSADEAMYEASRAYAARVGSLEEGEVFFVSLLEQVRA